MLVEDPLRMLPGTCQGRKTRPPVFMAHPLGGKRAVSKCFLAWVLSSRGHRVLERARKDGLLSGEGGQGSGKKTQPVQRPWGGEQPHRPPDRKKERSTKAQAGSLAGLGEAVAASGGRTGDRVRCHRAKVGSVEEAAP